MLRLLLPGLIVSILAVACAGPARHVTYGGGYTVSSPVDPQRFFDALAVSSDPIVVGTADKLLAMWRSGNEEAQAWSVRPSKIIAADRTIAAETAPLTIIELRHVISDDGRTVEIVEPSPQVDIEAGKSYMFFLEPVGKPIVGFRAVNALVGIVPLDNGRVEAASTQRRGWGAGSAAEAAAFAGGKSVDEVLPQRAVALRRLGISSERLGELHSRCRSNVDEPSCVIAGILQTNTGQR